MRFEGLLLLDAASYVRNAYLALRMGRVRVKECAASHVRGEGPGLQVFAELRAAGQRHLREASRRRRRV